MLRLPSSEGVHFLSRPICSLTIELNKLRRWRSVTKSLRYGARSLPRLVVCWDTAGVLQKVIACLANTPDASSMARKPLIYPSSESRKSG